MREELLRKDTESFNDYFVRLFQNKHTYRISCQKIADLLNAESGTDYTESKWRKEYSAFARGMEYAKSSGISEVARRILCISDLHIPFELPITTFADYVGNVDVLVLNGDITDCQAISKFPKAYRLSPMNEIIYARSYIADLIKYIHPKEVYINYGNHELRFQNYMTKNLDTDVLELMPKTSLELIIEDGFNHYDKLSGVKTYYSPLKDVLDNVRLHYTDSWFNQIGNTIFCHPLYYSSGILKTADKAVQYFRNEGYNFNSLIMGHTHRIGEYKEGNTMLFEQGCCCDVKKMNYVDGKLTPSQKQGFIYIAQDADGNIIREQTKLVMLN